MKRRDSEKHPMKYLISILACIILWGWSTQGYSQGWQWINPYPTGQNLNDVFFANECIGWFVGENGTIFKTLSGGKQWFSQFSLPNYDLNAVFAIDDQNVWAVGDAIAHSSEAPFFTYSFKILHSANGGEQWEVILDGVDWASDTSDFNGYELRDIHFANTTHGWAAGDSGLVVKSTDGGQNWQLVDPPTGYDIGTIQFVNESVGYLCGGELHFKDLPYPLDSTYSHGVILKTVDSGQSWQTLFADTVMIHQIHFINAQTGWAVGTAAWMKPPFFSSVRADYIFKTTDGGQSWQQGLYNGSIEMPSLSRIYFANKQLGFALGFNGEVLRSTDGGNTWQNISVVQRSVHHFGGAYFTDALNGYIVGADGVIVQTEDGGASWEHYDNKLFNGNIWHVHFLNPDTGWVVSDARYLIRTTDGGDNWENSGIGGIYTVDFPNAQHGWAVGEGGAIWHSNDAGESWQLQTGATNNTLKEVKFYNDSLGWIAGNNITLKTTDSGQNWFAQNLGKGGNEIILQDSLRLWVYGEGGYFTQDGGNTWYSWLDTIGVRFFLNADTGWAKSNNYLFRTINGGQSWEQVSFGASGTIFFVSAETGWSGSFSRIEATHDGGFTWVHELQFDVGKGINDFYFFDENHGWVAGMGTPIIRYGYPEKSVPIDSTCDKIVSIDTGFNEPGLPVKMHLYQNYPNPFNNTTTIVYELSGGSRVNLKIYDILGREIRRFVFENKSAGHHQVVWDSIDNAGQVVPSGIYFYRLSVMPINNVSQKINSETRRMLLLK